MGTVFHAFVLEMGKLYCEVYWEGRDIAKMGISNIIDPPKRTVHSLISAFYAMTEGTSTTSVQST